MATDSSALKMKDKKNTFWMCQIFFFTFYVTHLYFHKDSSLILKWQFFSVRHCVFIYLLQLQMAIFLSNGLNAHINKKAGQ